MRSRPTLRNIRFVAQLYVHRTWRRLRDRPLRLLAQILFFAGIWLYVLTTEVPAPSEGLEPAAIREGVRGSAALLWIAYASVAAWTAPTRASDIDGGTFLLRSAGLRATLWGSLLGKSARRIAILAVFAVGTAVVLLWGFDLPARDPLVVLAVLSLFVTAELTGQTARLLFTAAGIRFGGRQRILLGGVVLVICSFAVEHIETTLRLLSQLPVAVFGEAFLSSYPGISAARQSVVIALLASVVVASVLAVSVERLATRTWFDGSAHETVSSDRSSVGEIVGRIGIDGPARAVAWRVWLQTRRTPFAAAALFVPSLIIGVTVLESGAPSIPAFPIFLGAYSAWMVSMVLALNPLSSEDGTLSYVLSVPGREIVTGHSLAAATIGLPVIVVSTLFAGLLIGPASATGPGVLVGLALFVAGTPVAIATGLLLPRIDALDSHGSGPLAPNKYAMAVHGAVLLLLSAPTSGPIIFSDGWTGSPLAYAGVGITVLSSLFVGGVAFVLAGRRLDNLMLES